MKIAATYTQADNAQFLDELAETLEGGGQSDSAQGLRELAAREAQHGIACVGFVHAKLSAA